MLRILKWSSREPTVFTQGLTKSELKENIADVLELYMEDMREN